MLKKLFSWWTAKSSQSSSYQEILLRYRESVSPGYAIYSDIRTIETRFPNIEIYIIGLQKIIHALNEERMISPDLIRETAYRDSIAAFYRSNQQCYLDVDFYHQRFVEEAIAFIELYERKIEDPQITPKMEVLLGKAQPVLMDLISLSSVI